MKLHKSLLTWSLLAALVAIATVACGFNDLDPADAPTQVVLRPTAENSADQPSPTHTPVVSPTNSPPLPTYPEGTLEVHGADGWLNSDPIQSPINPPTEKLCWSIFGLTPVLTASEHFPS